ncbi:hydroxyethylthiazole kinase [Geodermatophilus sp. YIM 151500]|uniref:hydroxyethylthiazole kinase n=1 Tax=Geodermatophilus sp. YIM 151500 TaxID=2984531 RepID=UPI0021E46B13|nr:hydroxyethylthiazole kinase [Geodermatophilus sp. YIM 151500]MCV2491849.1 hydroxyethylthiazole kinase [Geodermatophilus sp. YIM 151500]
MSSSGTDALDLAAAREALRTSTPLVHCLTNTVVQALTANALLAAGAAPAMVDAPQEAGEFAAVASAVLVNVGTVHERTAEAMRLAARAAGGDGTPWVLDPVAVGGLPYRTALAAELVELRPTVVRGNASEVMALAGTGSGGRGVDSTAGADDAATAAAALAVRTGGVVAVSGEVDLVTDGRRTARVGGGSALLTRTTGAGCALGALVAAYCAVVDDPLVGAVAAHAHVSLAASRAADAAAGPGTFAAAWLDALDAVDGDALAGAEVRIAA